MLGTFTAYDLSRRSGQSYTIRNEKQQTYQVFLASGSMLTIEYTDGSMFTITRGDWGGSSYTINGNVITVSGSGDYASFIIEKTGTTPDTTPPTVSSTDPANSATNVPVTKTITVTFSESIQSS